MERKEVFLILNIEEIKNEAEIVAAYRTLLKKIIQKKILPVFEGCGKPMRQP